MKKKIFGLLMLVMFVILPLTIYGYTPDKDTLVVAQSSDVKSMDPVASNDIPSHCVYLHIYDTLLDRDDDGNLVPCLAQTWEQVDPLTLVLHLKEGVKFHNGEPFTAKDVIFSLNRAKEAPAVMSFFKEIDKVEALDDYTVKITTKEPFGPLLGYLAHKGGSIVNEKTVTEAGDNYAHHPIGTGPYKFVEWRSGDRVILEANPEYFRWKPEIPKIVFRVISEGTNRTIALETKEVDIAYDIEPMDAQFIKGNPDLVLKTKPSLAISYLGFNTQKAPFDKREVRKAIAYAVDLPSIINAVYLGGARIANSPIPPGVPGYTDDVTTYSHNPEKAKELLAKAGLADGFKAKLSISDKNMTKDIAIILQDQLKQIGIDLEIEVMEWGAYLDKLGRGEQDMFILGWVSPPEPDVCMYALFHSDNKGAGGNRTYYDNKRMNELLEKGRSTTEQAERNKYYYEAQRLVQDDIPMFVMIYPFKNAGMQKNIENFNLNADNKPRLDRVKKS